MVLVCILQIVYKLKTNVLMKYTYCCDDGFPPVCGGEF